MGGVDVGKSLTEPLGPANVVPTAGRTRVVLHLEGCLTPHADVGATLGVPEVGRIRLFVEDSHYDHTVRTTGTAKKRDDSLRYFTFFRHYTEYTPQLTIIRVILLLN